MKQRMIKELAGHGVYVFILGITLLVLLGLWHMQGEAQLQELSPSSKQSGHPLAEVGKPIAGLPFEKAYSISEQHAPELRNLPGVVSVSFTADGLVVETIDPSKLPTSIEGLPVIPIPPIDPRSAGGIEGATSSAPPQNPHEPPGATQPRLPDKTEPQSCPAGYQLDSEHDRCRKDAPSSSPQEAQLLPPPPGVIVLKPNGVREQANSCPDRFKEVKGLNNWRFCVDRDRPEVIPPLMAPPIAGIPFEKAIEIHKRHVEELSSLPGVISVSLGADAIYVETDNPQIIPKEVEGVPIKVEPSQGTKAKFLNHTNNTPLRPYHGAGAVRDLSTGSGTLAGVALSDGHPWLIIAQHLVNFCGPSGIAPPCPSSLAALNLCPHYNSDPRARLMYQPTISTVAQPVGYAQRWDLSTITTRTLDVAAAYMDGDLIEGNAAFSADRTVENSGGLPSNVPFSGIAAVPVANTSGYKFRTANSPHEINLRVDRIFGTKTVASPCSGGGNLTLIDQTFYTITSTGGVLYNFRPGDSGSPVFNANEHIVGMINICGLDASGNCLGVASGTVASSIQNFLKFDKWYGRDSVNDSTIGTLRVVGR